MARSRRTLDRKSLREQNEAAERSKKKDDEEVDESEDEEDEDEDEEEDEDGEDGESSESSDEDEGDDDEDEDRPKPKKKKKAAPKPKAPRTTRARTAKVVRMRVVWGVFNNSHQMVEEFDYPKKNAALELVNKLTTDKKSGHPFFLQPVKKPMEKEKEKEK